MAERFFQPYIGEHYWEGVNGKKILVLGASFYCKEVKCPYFTKCTDVEEKDSSKYDELCPSYQESGNALRYEPENVITDGTYAHITFADDIANIIGTSDASEVWSKLAFTNYVQFMLPALNDKYRETLPSDLSARDFHSFLETLAELRPDIVIIWGCTINIPLMDKNPYIVDESQLKKSNHYMCQIMNSSTGKPVILLNPYHPSYGGWKSNLTIFREYFKKALLTNCCLTKQILKS